MSDSEGCLKWFLIIIAWFVVFGICFSISEETGANILLLLFIAVIIIAAAIGLYKLLETRREDRLTEKVDNIKHKYPRAFRKFTSQPDNHINSYSPSIESLKKVAERDSSLWESEENELKAEEESKKKEYEIKQKQWFDDARRIKRQYPDGYADWEKSQQKKMLFITDQLVSSAESEIRVLDKHLKDEKWERSQKDFSNKCLELIKEQMPNYGRYFYEIPFVKTNAKGEEVEGNYEVWQFFKKSMCLADLDYTLFPHIQEQTTRLPEFKNRSRHFVPEVYEEIAKYLNSVAEYYYNGQGKNITVLFNYNKDWDRGTLEYHYKVLWDILSSEDYRAHLSCIRTIELDLLEEEGLLPTTNEIIIIDIATENTDLINLCKRIIAYDSISHPVIAYISLIKAYDREEMTELIDRENRRRAKILEEQEKEERAKRNLLESVSSWESLVCGLRYSYLFNYYPTTCDFEATEEEWDNRWLVWDFKNTPGKTSSEDHQAALEKAIPLVKQKLVNTFGEESLKYLTLVCIPASSQQKTKLRYEEFSTLICNELGMNNAYSHITVVTEKEERRSGGTSIDTSKLNFDDGFFDGKYILLFDDIITRGDSMRTFKTKMESLGAIVVGGLALGRTKHNR